MDKKLERLSELIQILNSLSIRHWIDGGTLLGAIREGGFIKGDNDIDLGVYDWELIPQLSKLKLILQERGWIIDRCISHDVVSIYSKDRPSVGIDIWRFNRKFNGRQIIFYHYGWKGYFRFPDSVIADIRPYTFLGIATNVPSRPERYLEELYGKGWKTPKSIKKPDDYPNYRPFKTSNRLGEVQ